MTTSSGIWALVPAAGVGTRMGADRPKQYLPLLGRPVIIHTLERLARCPRVRGIFVGLAEGDRYWPALAAHLRTMPKFAGTFIGGAERAHTVLNGLEALAARAGAGDWVMVHDAARPCVRPADIEALIAAVHGQADGGLLALPVADTVKRADPAGRIQETVPREGLWRALTPQLFPVARLTDALVGALAAGVAVTDEAAAIEHAGGRPQLVAGHGDNIKITLARDLALAELFLRQQTEEGA